MRGARCQDLYWAGPRRIIPADAGSTLIHDNHMPRHTDHPRGCGEHFSWRNRSSRSLGSSPRMRGAQREKKMKEPVKRIIPADAGSTHQDPRDGSICEDHPRGCGEHALAERNGGFKPGSSPRMRGAPVPPVLCRSSPRIIPADAGSTNGRPGWQSETGDHPRGCGEHA